WISLTNPEPSVLGGDVNWFKPTSSSAKFYSHGFSLAATAADSVYQPTNLTTVFGGTTFQIVLTGGDLTSAVTNQVSVDSRNRVTDLSGGRLSLSFSQGSGTFQGSLIDAGGGPKVPFQGVI